MAWLTGWSNRAPLTIDGTVPALSGAVTNGIACVAVPAALKAVCQAAGQDVRFTSSDGTTLLNHGIEDWSASAPVCHVRVPTVATGNTIIYAYGGNAGASDAQNKAGVATDYAGYWPLGDAGPTTAYDWTANANHGTQSGGVTFGAVGQVDGACDFDKVDDRITVPYAGILNPGNNFTMLCRAYWRGTERSVAGTRDALAGVESYGYGMAAISADTPGIFKAQSIGFIYGRTSWQWGFNGGAMNSCLPNAWTHMATSIQNASANPPTIKVYSNGVQSVGYPPIQQGPMNFGINANASVIGGVNTATTPTYDVSTWDGLIDSYGIYTATASADYIAFAAKSYPASSMFTWGVLESVPVTGGRSLFQGSFQGVFG